MLTALFALATSAALVVSPEIFDPGNISGGAHDASPAFTPRGDVVYFSRADPSGSTILVSRKTRHGWSKPVVASFSGRWNDLEPAMSADGSRLMFVSNRPVSRGGPALDGYFNEKVQPGQGGNLWQVFRTSGGWSAAERLPPEINDGPSIYAPSVRNNGDLLFMKPDRLTKRFRLFYAQLSNGKWQSPTAMPFSTGKDTDVDPAISPDGSYLVFGSSRSPAKSIDLFIAFNKKGVWTDPVHLGDTINSAGSDAEARIGPHEKMLYFASDRLVPQRFPRTRLEAAQATANADRWNNGLYNIWRLPLQPMLSRLRD